MGQEWRAFAACLGKDPRLFFASENHREEQKTALTICKGCPVRTDCFESAIEFDDFFIRGGTTYEERRIASLLRKALSPISVSKDAPSYKSLPTFVHTVSIQIDISHNSKPASLPSSSTPSFVLDQSKLPVFYSPLPVEVSSAPIEHETLPSPLFRLEPILVA